ncbi:hypothetical protein A3L11_10330 [Thermococcus siculi]|uniref:Uncharacterized protein n=1 Tax=Thermococcus siculi TaxID=72803 RepID=A0A2Z2MUY4_9EURY|nr:hypothetical protein [Thermococcus siculi]ASJ09606.1 hypothetical protein A3L11_10330 [Thermococcus siculi]
MPGQKEKIALMLIALFVLSGYTLSWLHERTLPSPGPYNGIGLEPEVFKISAHNLSSVAGNYKPLAYYRKRVGSEVSVGIEYHAGALRNVGCNQFQIRGRLHLVIIPADGSIAIRRVLVILENETNVTVDNLFPVESGVLYLKTLDGVFEMLPGYLPNHTKRQVMVIRAVRPSWGVSLEADPYVDLGLEKHRTEKEIEGRTRLVIRVDYLRRTGFFTSERGTFKVEIPMNYLITDLDSCPYR